MIHASIRYNCRRVPRLNLEPVCRGTAQQGGLSLQPNKSVRHPVAGLQRLDNANCVGESKAGRIPAIRICIHAFYIHAFRRQGCHQDRHMDVDRGGCRMGYIGAHATAWCQLVAFCGHEAGTGYVRFRECFRSRAQMAYPQDLGTLNEILVRLAVASEEAAQRPRAADSQGPRSEPFHQRRGLVEHWQHLVA
jgi:hypothetical protein